MCEAPSHAGHAPNTNATAIFSSTSAGTPRTPPSARAQADMEERASWRWRKEAVRVQRYREASGRVP